MNRTAVALCRASTPSRSRFAERNATLYQPLANGWKQLRRVDARHKATAVRYVLCLKRRTALILIVSRVLRLNWT